MVDPSLHAQLKACEVDWIQFDKAHNGYICVVWKTMEKVAWCDCENKNLIMQLIIRYLYSYYVLLLFE